MLFQGIKMPTNEEMWKKIAIHDDRSIQGFFSEYKYLSNFYKCTVYNDGFIFPSSEHAYMKNKLDPEVYSKDNIRELVTEILPMSCGDVKRWGSTIQLRKDWADVKLDIMSAIVFDKFYRNKDLRNLLLSTGDKYLSELNWWGDTCYGVDCRTGSGENNLGKILMKVRSFWK